MSRGAGGGAGACERLADVLREGSLSEIQWCNYTCYRSYLNIIAHSQGAVNREPPAAGAAQEQGRGRRCRVGGWRGLRLAAPALDQHAYKHSLHSLYLYFCMIQVCVLRAVPPGRPLA